MLINHIHAVKVTANYTCNPMVGKITRVYNDGASAVIITYGSSNYTLAIGAFKDFWYDGTAWYSGDTNEDSQAYKSGWAFDSNTWTYASATSFTVPGDQRAMFTKGRKVGAYQGSAWVWGTVLSSTYGAPNTTVNLIPNTSYSLANAVISQAIYNIIENPNTFPEYFNYSPTITSGAGSITSYTVNFARFKVIGNMVHVSCHFTITNNGTGAGDVRVTVPIVSATSAYGAGREVAAVGNMINIQTLSGASTLEMFTVTNTYPGGTGYQIMFSIGYLI